MKYLPIGIEYVPREAFRNQQSKGICPNCQSPFTWVQAHNSYYCITCGKYEKDLDRRPKGGMMKNRRCPKCRNFALWVPEWEKYMCMTCQKYLPDE
jgi:hypothetical protein